MGRSSFARLPVAASVLSALLAAGVGHRATASPNIAPSEHLTPEQEKATFHLPPGFEMQLVASEPDIHKPMNIAFDARGRLWVTDTVEYPFPVADGKPGARHGQDPRGLRPRRPRPQDHHLRRRAEHPHRRPADRRRQDRRLPGATAIPSIQRFLDTTGPARPARPTSTTRCSPASSHVDTHGMTNNFTRGLRRVGLRRPRVQEHTPTCKGTDGSEITMDSGNCYRFRPDGTRRPVLQPRAGQPVRALLRPARQPVQQRLPQPSRIYVLLRGAYYPSFGKPDDGLGFGPEMCDHDHGSTAIAGRSTTRPTSSRRNTAACCSSGTW